MADLDKLQIRISASSKTAVNNINNLVKALDRLNIALNGLDPSMILSVARSAAVMGEAMSSLSESGRNLNTISSNIADISAQMGELAQVANSTQNLTQSMRGAGESAEGTAHATREAAEGTKSLDTASKRASNTIKVLKAGFSGFSNTLKKIGSWFKSIAKDALKAATHINLFGKSAKSSKKHTSNLLKELTRIGKMLKLMITRMVLRQIISGIGDGFKNLAQYSRTFDTTLSLLWNDFRQLGNSIAAAASPLLNVFAPALHTIIQLVIQAVNAINQLLSAITGLSSFVRAKKLTDSYASSLDKSNKAAKALKKTVLGFDELNQLQDNDSGGGGTSPANMFEEAPISDKWKDWAAKIKKMWETGDFTELGKAIGEWLLNALNSIPWSKIYRTAAKLGKSLATLINGFVEVPELGYTMGKSLAKAVNTAFYFLDDFVRNLHWKSIGQFIGETLNGFFENIKWNKIYDTVYYGVRGIATAIQEAIYTFNWDNISNTLINALDVVSMGIKEFFENIDWLDLGVRMGDQLAKTIKGAPWKQVGEAIGSAIQAAIDWVTGFLDQLEVQDVVNALSDMLSGFFEQVDPQQAGENLGKILQFLIDTIKGFWEENHDEILEAVKNFFSGIFNNVDKEDLKSIVKGILGFALLNGISSLAIASLKIALTEKIKAIVAGAAAEKGVETAATAAGSTVGGFLLAGISAALGAGLGLVLSEYVKEGFFDIGEEIANSLGREDAAEKIRNMKEAYDGLDGSLNLVKDAGKEVARIFGADIPIATYTLTDELGNTKRVVDEYGNTVIDFTSTTEDSLNELSITVERDTDKMNKSVADFTVEPASRQISVLDGDFTHALDNMVVGTEGFSRTINRESKNAFDKVSLNGKVVTTDMPIEMANAQVSMTGTVKTLNKNVSDETKKGFDNAGKNSEKFTKDMPKNVTDAQESMSISVETLNTDFSTNMGDIQKNVADSTADMNKSFDTVKEGMTEDKWTFSGVWEGLTKTFQNAKDGIKGIWNDIADTLNGTFTIGSSTFTIDLPKFAGGGFPEDGLFMANHGEMVGKFSNGKTAVANNEQITNGIAQAVFSAMVSAQSSGGGQYINNTIMVDGDVIARAVTKGQERLNRRYSPVTI